VYCEKSSEAHSFLISSMKGGIFSPFSPWSL